MSVNTKTTVLAPVVSKITGKYRAARDSIAALGLRVVLEIQAARAPAQEPEHTFAIKTPGMDELIELPPPKLFDHPLTPAEQLTEGRRIAFDYAKKRSGKPELTWKQAKRLLDEWEKEEREVERLAEKERIARNIEFHRDAFKRANGR